MSKYNPYQQQYQPEYAEDEDEYSDDQNYGQQTPDMQRQPDMRAIQQMQQQMQPQAPQKPFNPYYDGIRNAIAEARESFGQSNAQKDRALRQSILSFGDSIGGMERERGFKNNLLAAGRALSPALKTYDQMGAADETSNEALANKMIAEKQAMQARALAQSNIEQDRALKQQMMQQQYGMHKESLMARMQENAMRRDAMSQQNEMSANNQAQSQTENPNAEISSILNDAKRAIIANGSNAFNGRLSQLGNFITGSGGNTEQAEIDTIGDILRGKLFNAWGYRNQAEFEHVPSISSSNSPERNLAIIKQLQNRFGNIINSGQDGLSEEQIILNNDLIQMQSPEGELYEIPASMQRDAELDGYKRVQ